jgi:hypothetical protein
MDIDVVIAVSEVVSAVAVVISLAYVGVQIRQNTVSQNAIMHQQLVASQNDAHRAIIDNEELSDLIARANVDFEALTPSEANRLNFLYINFFNLWQVAYANSQRGTLEQYLLDE